jgi:hypothetical protein
MQRPPPSGDLRLDFGRSIEKGHAGLLFGRLTEGQVSRDVQNLM